MRIISRFKDYYDTAMQHGQDQSVVFLRNDETLEHKSFDEYLLKVLTEGPSIYEKTQGKNMMFFVAVTIVFCGKVYRAIKCSCFEEMVIQEPKYFYSFEPLIEYLAKYDMELENKKRYSWHKDRTVNEVKEYLGRQGTSEFETYCIENNRAIITCGDEFHPDPVDRRRSYYQHGRLITANGELKKHQFFKVFDPIMAYQELDMYISGVLPQAGAMSIEIEDKYRIVQHGFDKMSFRKPKGK